MTLVFLANAASPHVRFWINTLPRGSVARLYDIHRAEPDLVSSPALRIVRPLPRFTGKLPKALQYVMLGLALRWRSPPGTLHAHNTSGFGLSAALSGKPYILTTYGSEIFRARDTFGPFRILIDRVLSRAQLVTCASAEMERVLVESFNVSRSAIFNGIAVEQPFIGRPSVPRAKGPRCWIANRRMTPLYRTLELIEAFVRFRRRGGVGRLILLEGDRDRAYAEAVAERVYGIPDIEIVSGFISQASIVKLLSEAHFAVSIPDTDQCSLSIVEAGCCGAIPVLRDLEAYKPVSDVAVRVPIGEDLVDSLLAMFERTSALTDDEWSDMSNRSREAMLARFSPRSFAQSYLRLVGTITGSEGQHRKNFGT